MSAPQARGHRLGVVLGSGPLDALLADATPATVATDRGPVVLFERGEVVLLRRHDGPPAPAGSEAGAPPAGARFVPAHLVDHHRNVAALCAAGCDRVLAVASVGSLRGWPVGTTVAPYDFYAPQVTPSFHDDARGHTVPGFHAAWRDRVLAAWASCASSTLLDGGVYAQTTGPRFETPAEVRALAAHADVVGMTVAAEAVLAGEADLAYAAVCVVDNLANGVGETALSPGDLLVGAAANATRLVGDLEAVVAVLADRRRPPAGGPPPVPGDRSAP